MSFNILIAGLARSYTEVQKTIASASHEIQKARAGEISPGRQRGQAEISGFMGLVENRVEDGLIIAFHSQSEENILHLLPPLQFV